MLVLALRRSMPFAALLLSAAPLRADTLKVPADFATIQAALDVAQAGDTVQVSKGVYAENLQVITSGITLKGKGATINGRYLGNCIFVATTDVTVDGFTLINGGGPAVVDIDTNGGLRAIGTGITLTRLTAISCADFGLRLDGTGSIDDCTVTGTQGDGLQVLTGNSAEGPTTSITRCTVTRSGGYGIFAVDGPFAIEKNTCERNGNDGLFVHITAPVADVGGVVGSTITGNKLLDNGSEGLGVVQDVGSEPALQITKNTLQGNVDGCDLSGSFLAVENNTIKDNLFDGVIVFASDCTVEKNKITGNGRFGISVFGATLAADTVGTGNNTLSANTVQDNGADGVLVESTGNEILGNSLKGNGGDGIELRAGSDNCRIADNKVLASLHDGLDNSGLNTVITGNTSKANGGADLAGAGDGTGTVQLIESTGNKVGDDSDLEAFSTLGELEMP